MSETNAPSFYPILRYDDAPAALEFLAKAFGFEVDEVHEEEGRVAHALVGHRDDLVMVSSRRPGGDPFDLGPCCVYVAVDDPDAHCDRARAAGAEILMELTDQDYGSRDYAARDPEGNVWCFGSYRPGRETSR